MPQTEAVQVPSLVNSATYAPSSFFFFVGQVGAERPRLCTLTRIAVWSVGRGCSWLTSWSGLVVRRDLCGREGAGTRGRLATSLPTQVCCCEPAKLQRTQIKALKHPASKLKPEKHALTHHTQSHASTDSFWRSCLRDKILSLDTAPTAWLSRPLLTPLADRWHIRPRAQIER